MVSTPVFYLWVVSTPVYYLWLVSTPVYYLGVVSTSVYYHIVLLLFSNIVVLVFVVVEGLEGGTLVKRDSTSSCMKMSCPFQLSTTKPSHVSLMHTTNTSEYYFLWSDYEQLYERLYEQILKHKPQNALKTHTPFVTSSFFPHRKLRDENSTTSLQGSFESTDRGIFMTPMIAWGLSHTTASFIH